jgi:LysR family glycine cleavage system transcriptional activator
MQPTLTHRTANRLPLTALRAFEAAARSLSFKVAAAELGVTPASVSNQIRQLEKSWACLLFVRKTRQLELTAKGHALFTVVAQAFSGLSQGIEALDFTGYSAGVKHITLAVGPLFGARWLAPRLGHWYAQHPQYVLALHQAEPIRHAHQLQTTAAIAWGDGHWPGLHAQRLLDCWFAPVLSPALLEKHAGLAAAADLARYPVVHQQTRTDWSAWMAQAEAGTVQFLRETVMADANMAIQAAIDGQGVALGVFPLVQGDIDAGRLVCPLDKPLRTADNYYLLTRPEDQHRREVQAMATWMAAQFS